MEKLVIDRGEWLTGTAMRTLDTSCLRHPRTGLMCCLGVYGKACGTPIDILNDNVMPTRDMQVERPWLAMKVESTDRRRFKLDTHVAGRTVQSALADINDSNRHQSRKESAVQYFFKKYGGVEVTFRGRYAEATSKAKRARRA